MVKEHKTINVNPEGPLRQQLKDTIGKLKTALKNPEEEVTQTQSELQVGNFLKHLDQLGLDLKSGKFQSTKHLNEVKLKLLSDYIRERFKPETQVLTENDPDLIIDFFNVLFPEEKPLP